MKAAAILPLSSQLNKRRTAQDERRKKPHQIDNNTETRGGVWSFYNFFPV